MAGLKNLPIATDALPIAAIDRRNGKPKIVSKKLRKTIDDVLNGVCKTWAAAAEKNSLASKYVSRALRQPHVASFVDSKVKAALADGRLRATARLLELIDAKSERVSFTAAELTLGISGLSPPQSPSAAVNVNVGVGVSIQPGYVIDLSEPQNIEEGPNG